jgi:hypothetical protein
VPYARPITDQEFSAPQRIAFLITLALLGPVAAYSAITSSGAISTEGGGDIEMYRDPSTGFAVNVNSSGYLLDAQNMIATLCIILIWLFRFRLWSFIPLLMFIAYRAFLGWGRYAIIMSVASVALLYLYRNRRRWPFLRYVVVAVPIFVLFQALGEQRDVFREMLTGKRPYSLETTGEEYKTWIEKQDNLDFANFEYLTAVVSIVPERTGSYTYFSHYLQLFTEPIPRKMWPEKPIGPPIQWVNLNQHVNFLGLTTSLVGDGWLSLGWIGVIVTMGLVGAFLGRLHRWFWQRAGHPFVVLIYCIFIPFSLQWFRDGGIYIAKFTMFSLFPFLCWAAIAKFIEMTQSGRPGLLRPRAEQMPDTGGR